MNAHFAEVLACEATELANVTDGRSLLEWRRRLVEKLMAPHSSYAKVLRQPPDVCGRSEFLGDWHELIAAALGRLGSASRTRSEEPVADHPRGTCDAHRTAVLILAALHGGSVLSQVSGDARPLDAALDLASSRSRVRRGSRAVARRQPDASPGIVTPSAASPRGRHLTARGARTRERIVDAAADLVYHQGVGATTLDDVVTASRVSKSQLYQHFSGKEMFVRAVVDLTGGRVIDRERTALEHVSTFAGLRRWRDSLVRLNGVRQGALGCPLGSLASGVSDRDEVARAAISAFFLEWERLMADVFLQMQADGLLSPEASARQLATGIIGALQGGYTLAQTAHDIAPMATSIDMALARIESLSTT